MILTVIIILILILTFVIIVFLIIMVILIIIILILVFSKPLLHPLPIIPLFLILPTQDISIIPFCFELPRIITIIIKNIKVFQILFFSSQGLGPPLAGGPVVI